MATIFKSKHLRDQEDPLKQRAVPTEGLTVMGASQPAKPAAPNVPSGKRYVGMGEYMALNRDQAQAAAKRVGNRLEGQAQGAVQLQDGVRDDFTKKANAGTVTFDPNKRDSTAAASQIATQGYSGPTSLDQADGYAGSDPPDRTGDLRSQEGQPRAGAPRVRPGRQLRLR